MSNCIPAHARFPAQQDQNAGPLFSLSDQTKAGTPQGTSVPDRIRVLSIDDEPDLLELGKLFLERSGEFSVDTAVSAGIARTMLATGTYDAIVSDYQMPVEDGLSFLKSVRGTLGDIPFILFSGRGREEVIIQAIDYGVDSYIQKGGNAQAQFAELAHKIRHAVIRYQQAARRKAAEEALRESEAKFALLFQNSPAVLMLTDATDMTFVAVNDSFVQCSGYSREEVIGRTADVVGMDIDSDISRPVLTELQNTSRAPAREVRFRNKNGEFTTCLFSITSITIRGKPYYLSSAEDISRLKALENQLKEKQYLLEEAMDLAHLGDWTWDLRIKRFIFNDRIYALCKTTAEREGGYQMEMETYLREFVHPDDRDKVVGAIREGPVTSEQSFEYFIEHHIIRRDGAVRFMVVRVKIERDASGAVSRIHGVNQDITGYRQEQPPG